MAWVGAHPAVTAPIIGARKPTQLEDSLNSLPLGMTEELFGAVSSFSPAPPPATHPCSDAVSGALVGVVALGVGAVARAAAAIVVAAVSLSCLDRSYHDHDRHDQGQREN